MSRVRPSGPALVATLLVVAMPLIYGRNWLAIDGDPARHIRVGETILRDGLFFHDQFSFTKSGAPFVPYEWLSEVLAALSVRFAGLPGLIVLTGAVFAATYGLVTYTLLKRGVRPLLTGVVLLFVMAMGIIHWQVRPHAFTFLGVALLLALVDPGVRRPESSRSSWSAAWPMIPLFALWANLHGGFLYGLFVLGTVAAGDSLELIASTGSERAAWSGTLTRHAGMLAAAVAGSLVTPNGVRLYTYTLRHLHDAYLIDITNEFKSPDFHGLYFALIAIVLVLIALAVLPKRPRFPALLLIAASLAFALQSVRNLPLFAIVALPVLAADVDAALPPWPTAHKISASARTASHAWLALPLVALGAMLCLARVSADADTESAGFTAIVRHRLPTDFDSVAFPVRAVRQARARGMAGRLYNSFTWGGYILYAWPEQRVFIDGQTDFYGDSITREHDAIIRVQPGWRRRLADWRIDLALIETKSSLSDALAHEPGWRPILCDPTAILFAHDAQYGPALGPSASMLTGCEAFPDSLARTLAFAANGTERP